MIYYANYVYMYIIYIYTLSKIIDIIPMILIHIIYSHYVFLVIYSIKMHIYIYIYIIHIYIYVYVYTVYIYRFSIHLTPYCLRLARSSSPRPSAWYVGNASPWGCCSSSDA